jgi:hypothetical protein
MRWEKNVVNDARGEHLITIIDGRLVLVENGTFILLTSPVLLRNGTVVSTEGMMKMPDGKNRMLREGEYV